MRNLQQPRGGEPIKDVDDIDNVLFVTTPRPRGRDCSKEQLRSKWTLVVSRRIGGHSARQPIFRIKPQETIF